MANPNSNNNAENDYNAKYANWNAGYEDLFAQIKEIRHIGNLALFDFKNNNLLLNQYYSRIAGLFSSHAHYVIQRELIKKQLIKIEDVLFSQKYKDSITNQTNSTQQQIKILRDLRYFFQLMCESFSRNGLTMKIIKEPKDDPHNAVMRGYN